MKTDLTNAWYKDCLSRAKTLQWCQTLWHLEMSRNETLRAVMVYTETLCFVKHKRVCVSTFARHDCLWLLGFVEILRLVPKSSEGLRLGRFWVGSEIGFSKDLQKVDRSGRVKSFNFSKFHSLFGRTNFPK